MLVQDDINASDFGLVKSDSIDFKTASEFEVKAFSEEWYLDLYQRDIMLNQLRTYKSDYRTKFKNPPVEIKLPVANEIQYAPPIQEDVKAIPQMQISAPVVNSYDIIPFDAARMVIETWEPWMWDRIQSDREGYMKHRQIKTEAEEFLKTEPGYVEPVFQQLTAADFIKK
jgi:hypothetical protein